MPNHAIFPSLDLEIQQVKSMGLQDPGYLPDMNISSNLQAISDIYSRIKALKSANPLLSSHGKSPSDALKFPSIKEASSPINKSSDAIPTPFDPGRERYDRYRDSKYYKNIGFIPGRDNEELYGRAQSGWGALAAGITGAWKIAKFQFVDQLKGWGRLVDGIFSGDLSKIYDDNDLQEVNTDMQRIMDENPVFLTEKDRNSVMTWANFANIVQQSGFTLGALAEIASEELLMSAITTATGGAFGSVQAARTASMLANIRRALGRLFKVEEVLYDANRTRKLLGKMANYTPFTHTLGFVSKGMKADEVGLQFARRGFGAIYRDLREANAAFTEARAENSGTYSEVKNDLLYQYYDRGITPSKDILDNIEKTAREAADANFWANAAIIGISNRIQFDNVFKGFKGATKYIADVGEISRDKISYFKRSVVPFTKGFIRTAKAETIPNFVRYFKNNITEALQENLQNVSNDSIKAYYEANYNNPGSTLLRHTIYDAISNQFTTEGAKTFLSGFLTAAITSPVSRGIPALYNRVSTTKEQRQRRKANIENQISVLNGFFSKPEGRNAAVQFSISGALGEAVKNNDIKSFLDLKDRSVESFVRAAIETGTLESLFDRLYSTAKGLTKEEFEKAYGIEYTEKESDTPLLYIEKLRRRARQIKEIKEDLDFKFANPFSVKESDDPETQRNIIRSHQIFEGAKWHVAYMKNAHLRTSQRQTSILADMQEDMKDVSYSALSTLLDVQRAKDEVAMLKKEASLITDPRQKEQKLKKAAILSALIPSLEKGDVDKKTFGEYVNIIQEQNKLNPVAEETISDNHQRIVDYLSLEDDKKKLMHNLNLIADPEFFSEFVRRHEQYIYDQAVEKAQDEYIEAEIIDPVAEEHPNLQITYDKEGNGGINITPKEGSDATQEEVDEAAKKIEEKLNQKDEKKDGDPKEEYNKGVKDRLEKIYEKLKNTGEISDQDVEFVNDDNIMKDFATDPNLIKILELLKAGIGKKEEKSENEPEPEKGPEEGDKVEEKPDSQGDEDAYPHHDGSEKESAVSIPEGAGKTIIQEVVDGYKEGKRNENGDVILWGGYAHVRGEFTRFLKNNPEFIDSVEFAIVIDNREYYTHVNNMSKDAKEQLDVFNENSPYFFWIHKNRNSTAPVLIIRDRKTKKPIYVNPNTPGMFSNEKEGVIVAFAIDYRYMGLPDSKSITEFLRKQPKQEVVIDYSSIDPISLGSYYENETIIRDLKSFLEGTTHESSIYVSIGDKYKEWNPENEPNRQDVAFWNSDNTRNGGVFLRINNLNLIKLVPSRMDELKVNGETHSIAPLFALEYTNDELEKITTELKKIIYSGPFKPKNQFHEKIIISSEPGTEAGKSKLKLIRLVDTTPELPVPLKVFKDSGQSTDLILRYLNAPGKEGRRMNVSAKLDQDISIPIIKDGAVQYVDMSYLDFLNVNLFTSKARNVNPDGSLTINPTNNFFIIPNFMEAISGNAKTQKKDEDTVSIILAEKPEDREVEKQPEPPAPPSVETVTEAPKEDTPAPPSIDEIIERLKKDIDGPEEDRDNDPEENPDDLIAKVKDTSNKALVTNKELRFIRDRFGDHVLNHITYAVNSDYWGYWKNAVITLYSDAQRGVGYHEAWHHFSQMFLTRDEKIRLYNEVMSENPSLRGKDLKAVEEYLADRFAEYAVGREDQPPVRRNIFQKIWDFLVRIFKGRSTPRPSDLDKYFSDLYDGKLNSYRPTINNAFWGRLNYGIKVNGNELFDPKETQVVKNFFNTLLYKALVSKDKEYNLKAENISMASLISVRDNKVLSRSLLNKVIKAVRVQFLKYLEENKEQIRTNLASNSIIERFRDNYHAVASYVFNELRIPISVEDIVEEDPDNQDTTVKDQPVEGEKVEAQEAEIGIGEGQFSDRVIPFKNPGLFESVSKVMRSFLSTIPKVVPIYNDEGEITDVTEYKNAYGLTESADPHRMMAILGEELAGIFKDNELIDKLNSDELFQRLPEVKFIRETLPGFGQGEGYSIQTLMSLMRDFNRVKVPVYSGTQLTTDGRIILIEKTKTTHTKIKRIWQDNLISGDNVVFNSNLEKTYLHPEYVKNNWNLVIKGNKPSQEIFSDRIKFLEGLGVVFSPRTLKTRALRALISGESFYSFASRLNERLENGQQIENVLDFMSRPFEIKEQFISEDAEGFPSYRTKKVIPTSFGFISDMLRIETIYSDIIPSNAYITANNTKKFSLMLPSMFNIVGAALRDSSSLGELRANNKRHLFYLVDDDNVYTKGSLILSSLYNREGALRSADNFQFGDYNGLEYFVNEKKINKQSSDLTGREKLILDLNSFLDSGLIDIMRTGSSSSFYGYKMNEWFHTHEIPGEETLNPGTNIPISTRVPFGSEFYNNGRPGINFHKALRGYFYNLLLSEVSVMRSENQDVNLPLGRSSKFGPKIRNWGVFDKILSTDLKRKIGAIPSDNLRNGLKDLLEDVMKEVNQFFDRKTDVFVNYAKRFGIAANDDGTPPNIINSTIRERYKSSWKELARNFVINSFVTNVEYSRIFTGIPQFYSDFHKRASGVVSPGNNLNTGSQIARHLANTYGKTMSAALEKPFRQDIEIFRTVPIKDDFADLSESTQKSWRELGKIIGKEAEIESMIKEYNQASAKKKPLNDGSAYVTLDFYRQMLMMSGNWDLRTDEIEYTKEVIKWKMRKNLYKSEEQIKEAQDYLNKYPGTRSQFHTAKFQYNGPQKNKGIMLHTFHKFALIPLVPSVFEGTELEKLHDWLLDEQIDYAVAESGTKDFSTDAVPLWKDGTRVEFGDFPKNHTPEFLFSTFLKEQIKTAKKHKNQSTWGTQIKSIWLSNRFDAGNPSSKKYKELLDRYNRSLESLIESEKEQLFAELGIQEVDVDTFQIQNVTNLVKTLKEEAQNRDLNSNVQRMLGIDPITNSFAVPLEIITNRQAVVDLISGLIFKRLISLKVNGDMVVQIPSTGTLKNGEPELRTYEPIIHNGKFVGVRAAQTKIAFNNNFKPLLKLTHYGDKKRIGTIERLNEMLKNKQWVREHRKEITIIAYRFPTEGPHSIEFLEVAEFLPEVFNGNMIVNREIVIKSGSDFDHDKLNLIRPSYNPDGTIIGEEVKEEYERALEKLYNFRRENETLSSFFETIMNQVVDDDYSLELEDDIANEFGISPEERKVISEFKKAKYKLKGYYTNVAIQSYIESFSSPEMFFQLVRPNTTDKLKGLALEVANLAKIEGFTKEGVSTFANTEIFDYTNNHIKFLQNIEGQSDLGVWAVLNKVYHNLQIAGIKFNEVFRNKLPHYYRGASYVLSTTPHLLTPTERERFMSDGKITLGAINDVSGRNISEVIAELMNATVDIEKDPFYSGLGINRYNRGIAAVLLMMRVPIRRISLFLMQPILKEYYSRMEKYPFFRNEDREDSTTFPSVHQNAKLMLGLESRLSLEKWIQDNQNVKTSDVFSEESLLGKVGSKDWNVKGQKPIFAHFLMLHRLQQLYMKMQAIITTDTKKIGSPIAARLFERNEADLLSSGLIDVENMEKLKSMKLTAPIHSEHIVKGVFAAIFPVGFSESFTETILGKIQQSDAFFTKEDIIRFERTSANDYMMYIVMQHGEFEGKRLKQYISEQIKKRKKDTKILAERLSDMKKAYPEIFETFNIAKNLRSNPSSRNRKVKNIEITRGIDNTKEMQEMMIYEFQKLVDFRGNETPGRTYTGEEVANIRRFFRDVAIALFGQAGFNRSLFYVTDILPLEELNPIMRDALKKYKQEVENNPDYETDLLDAFIEEFSAENPRFGLRSRFTSNREPFRGKYLVRETDLEKKNQPKTVVRTTNIITREDARLNTDTLYVFGDNIQRRGLKGQAADLRGEPNAIGVATKRKPASDDRSYFSDKTLEENKLIIRTDIDRVIFEFQSNDYQNLVILPIGQGLAKLQQKAPLTYQFLQEELNRLEMAITGKISTPVESQVAQTEQVTGPTQPQGGTPDIGPGRYVKFNDEIFIVTKVNDNGTIQIYDPTKEGIQAKKSVAAKNLTPMNTKGSIVTYKEKDYIVTPKNTIISLTTNRRMNWDENNADRKAILELAKDPTQVKQAPSPKPQAPGIVARIPMKFTDGDNGRRMREEFRGKSTMDLVLAGYRTATTRDANKDYNKLDLNVGDIVEFYDDKGRTARVIITHAPYPINKVSRERWSKLEGWDASLYDEILKRKGNYQQYRYKLYSEAPERTTGGPAALRGRTVPVQGDLFNQPVNDPKTYTNHSGGAIGSDSQWDIVGREFGVDNHIHYWYDDGNKKPPFGNKKLTNQEREEGWENVLIANQTLKRKPNAFKSLLSRNWFQVKNSDAVFAIGNLKSPTEVEGGTGWAVQMAIDNGKPVYVFDQASRQWNEWNKSYLKFTPIETPKLTKNFAGIGTRKIDPDGLKAIRDVYAKTFGNSEIDDVLTDKDQGC